MPGLEELERYFRGLWLLATGKSQGFAWLDLTERGLWRSFWAVVYCLPPILLNWAAYRLTYLSLMPAGSSVGGGFLMKMLAIDVVNWLVPYLALAAVIFAAGYKGEIVVAVIVINWLAVPMNWLMVTVSLAQIFSPGNVDLQLSIALPILILYSAALFLLLRQVLSGNAVAATAAVLSMAVTSIWASSAVQGLVGLSLDL